jgi:hypothetical protein
VTVLADSGFDSIFGTSRGLTDEEGAQADKARMSEDELVALREKQEYDEYIRLQLEQDRREQAKRDAISKRVKKTYFDLMGERPFWQGRELIDAAKARCPDISHTVMCSYFMSYCKEYFDSRDLNRITMRKPEDWGC